MAETDSIRFGDPRLPERFWSKVRVDPTGCWLWTASKDLKGYGTFQLHSRRAVRAHRIAVEILVAPIPVELTCDHLCRVKNCVNPAHIEVVTNRTNSLRGNNACAINARKTHCARGHEFTLENTTLRHDGHRSGHRTCYTCVLIRSEKSRKKLSADPLWRANRARAARQQRQRKKERAREDTN